MMFTKKIAWIHKNLAPTPLQALFTIVGLVFLAYLIQKIFLWGLWDATFLANSSSECGTKGACWAIIRQRWQQLLYGFYPVDQVWRVNTALLILAGCLIGCLKYRIKIANLLLIITCSIMVIIVLLLGGYFNLSLIQTDLWGGLSLTIFLSVSGIIGAIPLALLLAFGRKSELFVFKVLCTFFIELIRGVPLISVLFMASFMLPLFLPDGINIDKLLRALVGIVLFQAAYLSEVIRGGLNAIPKGQYEASYSLGLSYFEMVRYIILPQALRHVIPGIVNTFIALFKDTTLVMIIGILDFLGIVQAAITDPKWIGRAPEAYIFCAFVYWICCFSMSCYSKHLESKLRIS